MVNIKDYVKTFGVACVNIGQLCVKLSENNVHVNVRKIKYIKLYSMLPGS